jgi:hypothetical protein
MRLVSLALSLVFLLGASAPEPVRGLPPLRTIEGRRMLLLGSVPRLVAAKQTLWALYVDEVDAKRAFPPLAARAGGRDRSKLLASDHATTFAIWGAFGKLLQIRIDAPLAPSAIKPLFEELLQHELTDKQPEVKKAAKDFVALFDSETELPVEESIQIRTTPDGDLVVDIAGELKPALKNPKVVRAIWSGLLGNNGAADVKKGLVEGIDRLTH